MIDVSTPTAYRSLELEHIQQRPNSPFGMQFLAVPNVRVQVSPVREDDDPTRSCEETNYDGKSKLDCVDD